MSVNISVGDHVQVLNEALSGVVIAVRGDMLTIQDDDGFEWQYNVEEVVRSQSIDYGITEEDEPYVRQKLKDEGIKKLEQKLSSSSSYIDLHIEELVDDHSNLTNFEIVSIQMSRCKQFVLKALDNDLKKITIIHGKGEGVLRSEVHEFLDKLRTENEISLSYHDASFQEFGFGGATEVVFF